MNKLHLRLLALGLLVLGLGTTWYKVSVIGLPLERDAQTEIWTVEARITLNADDGPTQVGFAIPNNPPGFNVLGEAFVSGRFGLARESDGINRTALWTSRRSSGNQSLYYRIQLADDRADEPITVGAAPEFPERPDYQEPYASAVEALLDEVRAESADIASFTRRLLLRYNSDEPGENVEVLRSGAEDDLEHTRNIIHILAGARIPARPVKVLELSDRLSRGSLKTYFEVHNGTEWVPFNPRSSQRGYPKNAVVWQWGDDDVLRLSGANNASVQFSSAVSAREAVRVAEQRAAQRGSLLMDFSLFNLPIQAQNTYRVLLLVPVGALVMVLMRNVVGISTFGTFMPILIALAFRETQLAWGIFLFTTVVAFGLAIRFYLENLKLLLVPRLGAVLVVVVLLMAAFSVLTHQLGLDQGLSIALFPMVILAMTIERMSLVWEEHGPGQAITQGLGSLAVAIVGYLVMFQPMVEHLVFTFPELLLVILALMLLLGRYTGYRLTELWRFRHLIMNKGAP